MTTSEAKRAVTHVLKRYGLANRLTARKVDFMDLARKERIFVTIHGWSPSITAVEIRTSVPGVCIQFTGGF